MIDSTDPTPSGPNPSDSAESDPGASDSGADAAPDAAPSSAVVRELAAIGQQFIGAIPHSRALGMEILSIGSGSAMMRVPYDPRLVGDPATGVLHGGVITALLDSCSGAAVLSHPSGVAATATIDLRIDYMRPGRPGRAITCRATCHRITRTVAFVRGEAWDEDETDPVATSAGAFTVTRRDKPAPKPPAPEGSKP